MFVIARAVFGCPFKSFDGIYKKNLYDNYLEKKKNNNNIIRVTGTPPRPD